MSSSGIWKYIAPTSLGAAYAITKMLSIRALDPELAIAQDFTYQFLAGILLGFALRPVTSQIYWKRTTSIIFFSLFLLILGPIGQLIRHRIWGITFDDTFWLLLFVERLKLYHFYKNHRDLAELGYSPVLQLFYTKKQIE